MAGHSPTTEVLARLNNSGVIWYACFDYIVKLLNQERAVEQALIAQTAELHTINETIAANTAAVCALRDAIAHNEDTQHQIAAGQIAELNVPTVQMIAAFKELSTQVQGMRQQLREYDARASAAARPSEPAK